jgi:hypothetical protein
MGRQLSSRLAVDSTPVFFPGHRHLPPELLQLLIPSFEAIPPSSRCQPQKLVRRDLHQDYP